MPVYRDDHRAALDRAESLETEIGALKTEHNADQYRIARLEAELKAKQNAISQMQAGYSPGYNEFSMLPSNATNVLIFGVLGIALCQLLGPVAWSMANKELLRIDLGEADPTKRGTVMAGKILGVISTVMMSLGVVWMLFVMAMSAGSGGY